MENQQPNTVQNSSQHSFFIQQGQHINRIHELLHSYSFAFGLKVFLSVVLQIACYLLFAFAIYLAIMIPTDLPSLLTMMGEESRVFDLVPTIPVLTEFLLEIKIIIAAISLPVLICALLLGRNRRKSVRIRKAFQEAEAMKAHYAQAMSGFSN